MQDDSTDDIDTQQPDYADDMSDDEKTQYDGDSSGAYNDTQEEVKRNSSQSQNSAFKTPSSTHQASRPAQNTFDTSPHLLAINDDDDFDSDSIASSTPSTTQSNL